MAGCTHEYPARSCLRTTLMSAHQPRYVCGWLGPMLDARLLARNRAGSARDRLLRADCRESSVPAASRATRAALLASHFAVSEGLGDMSPQATALCGHPCPTTGRSLEGSAQSRLTAVLLCCRWDGRCGGAHGPEAAAPTKGSDIYVGSRVCRGMRGATRQVNPRAEE